MKNIEKYHETKGALEAYNKLDFKKVPFDIWLECEYEEPCAQTLLEAAEAVIDEWYYTQQNVTLNDLGEKIVDLKNAIARKRQNPVRNFDKYETAKEAFDGFREMCFRHNVNECKDCPFRDSHNSALCVFEYLYAEAK